MTQDAVDFKVYQDGSPIPSDVVAAVIQVRVDDPLNAAACAFIKLSDPRAVISDGDHFKVGTELKIELGYVGKVTQVFIGDVTGLKASFPARGPQTLTVIAQDRFHRLRRSRVSKTFLEMKDSEVVAEVAKDTEGINASDVEDTPFVQTGVLQVNQCAADFVLERASLYGYEVFVDDKTLIFRSSQVGESAVATLKWGESLHRFDTSISLFRQQQELTVSSWNMKDKEAVSFTAKKGDERDLMGGSKSGAELVKDVDGVARVFTTTPAFTEEEAKAYALGLFQKRSERFLQGEGSCVGDPAIRRGTLVEVEGIGSYLAGSFYVQRAVHTLLPGYGYTTYFYVVRTALEAPATPPPTYEHQEATLEPVSVETEGEPLSFEVSDSGGAPLGGVPYVLVDPAGEKESGDLSSDGKVEIEFEES